MADVRTRQVAKQFRAKGTLVDAVKDANVDIRDGEFVVFVGPSGSGKTTFLRMVAGLELPTSGQIYIGDRDVTTMHPRARGVAMVFQDYALYPHMTVRQNMGFALENLHHPRQEIKQRVQAAAEMLQIGELLDRRPRELSGGQRQRVALGRAIVRQPQAFLFDEPLSNLDARLRVQMRIELADLHRRLGTTSLYVTHDQVEAMTLGQRIYVMNHGVIQQVGTSGDLYDHPANTFVAGFIGSPPMNLLPVRLLPGDEGLALVLGRTSVPLPPAVAHAYAAYVERDLLCGIRPEQIAGAELPTTTPGWSLVEVKIHIVENLGAEKLVHFALGDHQLVAKLAADVPICDAGCGRLAFNLNRLHLFDPATGLALRSA
jgi:multiple sugar transport system ATP-binding protein